MRSSGRDTIIQRVCVCMVSESSLTLADKRAGTHTHSDIQTYTHAHLNSFRAA